MKTSDEAIVALSWLCEDGKLPTGPLFAAENPDNPNSEDLTVSAHPTGPRPGPGSPQEEGPFQGNVDAVHNAVVARPLGLIVGETVDLVSHIGSVTVSITEVLGTTYSCAFRCTIEAMSKPTADYKVGQQVVVKIFDYTRSQTLRHLFGLGEYEPEESIALKSYVTRGQLAQFIPSLFEVFDVRNLGRETRRYAEQEGYKMRLQKWEIIILAVSYDAVRAELDESGFLPPMPTATRASLAWLYAILLFSDELEMFRRLSKVDPTGRLAPLALDVFMRAEQQGHRPSDPFAWAPLIMMEYVEGQSILEYLNVDDLSLRFERAARATSASSLAIVSAWRCHLQHTDLHLDNLRLVEDNNNTVVRFLDVASFRWVSNIVARQQLLRLPDPARRPWLARSRAFIRKDDLLTCLSAHPSMDMLYDQALEHRVQASIMRHSRTNITGPDHPRYVTPLIHLEGAGREGWECVVMVEDIHQAASRGPYPLSDKGLHWLLCFLNSIIQEPHVTDDWAERVLTFVFGRFAIDEPDDLLRRYRATLAEVQDTQNDIEGPNVSTVVKYHPICLQPTWDYAEETVAKSWHHQQGEITWLVSVFRETHDVTGEEED